MPAQWGGLPNAAHSACVEIAVAGRYELDTCNVCVSIRAASKCWQALLVLASCRTAVHMAARAADAQMMGVLLDALPEAERTELINAADKSGITPVFLAFQRCAALACWNLYQQPA